MLTGGGVMPPASAGLRGNSHALEGDTPCVMKPAAFPERKPEPTTRALLKSCTAACPRSEYSLDAGILGVGLGVADLFLLYGTRVPWNGHVPPTNRHILRLLPFGLRRTAVIATGITHGHLHVQRGFTAELRRHIDLTALTHHA